MTHDAAGYGTRSSEAQFLTIDDREFSVAFYFGM
jgi:hypothetical protein